MADQELPPQPAPEQPAPGTPRHVTIQIILQDDKTLRLNFGAHLGDAEPQQVFDALAQLAIASENMCIQLATVLAIPMQMNPPQVLAKCWQVIEQAKLQNESKKLIVADAMPQTPARKIFNQNGSPNGLRLRH